MNRLDNVDNVDNQNAVRSLKKDGTGWVEWDLSESNFPEEEVGISCLSTGFHDDFGVTIFHYDIIREGDCTCFITRNTSGVFLATWEQAPNREPVRGIPLSGLFLNEQHTAPIKVIGNTVYDSNN